MEKSRRKRADRRGIEQRRVERRKLEYRKAEHNHIKRRNMEPRSVFGRVPKKMVLAVAVLLFLAGAAGMGIWFHRQPDLKGIGDRKSAFLAEQQGGADASEMQDSAQDSAQGQGREQQAESSVFSDFQAGTVKLTGLTAEEAQRQLKEAYQWEMEVVNGDERAPVKDLTGAWAAKTAEQIRQGTLPLKGSTAPDYDEIEAQARIFAQELGKRWDESPVDSQVEAYDKETKVYTYSQEKSGRALNQEALADAIMEAVKTGKVRAEIRAEFTEIPPARTRRQAKEQYRVIGTFETKTTDNKNRNQNIRLAAEAIDGMVIQPGKEFSFNSATGNRTSEKGYQPAGAYKNGILIEEPGGGVCQVSTTLYHAIIGAGYKTTERNAHSFAPSYVEQGQDAMVNFDGYAGPDLKFVNTGSAAVVLRASFDGKKLKLSIVGLPILDEGVKVSIRSEKVSDVNAPEPVYEENPALPYGTEQTVDAGKNGSVWKSYRVTTKDGQILEETPLHNSYYKPKTALIQKNTLALPTEPVSGNMNTEGMQEEAGVLPGDAGTENDQGAPGGTAQDPTAEVPAGLDGGPGTAQSGPAGDTAAP